MCCIGGVCRPQTWTFQSATAAAPLYFNAPKPECVFIYNLYTMLHWSKGVLCMDSEEKGSQKFEPTKTFKNCQITVTRALNMFKCYMNRVCWYICDFLFSGFVWLLHEGPCGPRAGLCRVPVPCASCRRVLLPSLRSVCVVPCPARASFPLVGCAVCVAFCRLQKGQ
jgi:hypothetical protein